MAWYKLGTATLTSGSATVTFTGADMLVGANAGDGFQAPNGDIIEIQQAKIIFAALSNDNFALFFFFIRK